MHDMNNVIPNTAKTAINRIRLLDEDAVAALDACGGNDNPPPPDGREFCRPCSIVDELTMHTKI